MAVRYIIQARLSSTRLPQKTIEPIGNKPLISHIIERILKAGAMKDEIFIAVPEDEGNELEKIGENYKIHTYRGSRQNVLQRYMGASEGLDESDIIIRITGDNPFLDFKSLKEVIKVMNDDPGIDLSYPYKLPLGMGFEAFRKSALFKQTQFNLKPHHEEHVTTFMKENKNTFNITGCHLFDSPEDIRLTVDYKEDLDMVNKVWEFFHNLNNDFFTTSDILNLYKKNRDFFSANAHMEQKKPTEYEKPS